jgi:hypothetical protein
MRKRDKPSDKHVGPMDGMIRKAATKEELAKTGALAVIDFVAEPTPGHKPALKKKKKSKKKDGKKAVAFKELPKPKRANDRASFTSVTQLSLVQLIRSRVGTLHPSSGVFNAHLFDVLKFMLENGATATFGDYERMQEAIMVPESTARRWWKKYVKDSETPGVLTWEGALIMIADNPKDKRSIEMELHLALSKANRAGRKSPLSQELLNDLERLAVFASTTSEGLHYSRLISFVMWLLIYYDEKPVNKKLVPYKFGKSWANSWLYRREFVARAKTNSTGKDLPEGIAEEHLLRGAYLVRLLNIRKEDVCGFDEVPMKLSHSAGKTLAKEGSKEVLGGTKEKDNKAQITVTTFGFADGTPGIPQMICKGSTPAVCPVPMPYDWIYRVSDNVKQYSAGGRARMKKVFRHPLDDSNIDSLCAALESGSFPIPFFLGLSTISICLSVRYCSLALLITGLGRKTFGSSLSSMFSPIERQWIGAGFWRQIRMSQVPSGCCSRWTTGTRIETRLCGTGCMGTSVQ